MSTQQPGVGDVNSDARGSGARFNSGKTPFKYTPLHLLAGAARVFQKATTRPVNPYPMWNWSKGMPWSVPYECALRHLDAWYRGEATDADSSESHLAHAMCNLLMLVHYEAEYAEGDDRPKGVFGFNLSAQLTAQEMRDATPKCEHVGCTWPHCKCESDVACECDNCSKR